MYVIEPFLSPLASSIVCMSCTSSKSPLGIGHSDGSGDESDGATETLSINVPPAPAASVPLRNPIR